MSYRSAARTFSALTRSISFVGRHPFAFGVGLVVAVFLSVGLQLLERREATAGERRFLVRANVAATFVAAYLTDLRSDQRAALRPYLTSGRIGQGELSRLVRANRFGGAILLDASGRVSQAHPSRPGLIGARLSERYWHLQEALAGRDAVSNVVPSAAEGVPVVAIASPIRTPTGRGVFGTAYALSSSPLTAYLASAMPIAGDDAYLVDAHGSIVASKRREPRVTQLSVRDAGLAAAISERTSGILSDDGEERFFVVRHVEGTPWRLVATRPLAAIHPTWHGEQQWISMAVAVALGAGALLIAALIAGLLETRTRLLRDVARREHVEFELVRERALLAHQATHDPLTGLPNRALLFARMEQAYAHGARDPQRRAAVLFIDLDGFKPVNDVHGHEVGDRVLTTVGERLRDAVRPSDTVSRLGGDEFAILCDPLAGTESACAIAERVRRVLERPIAIGDGRTVCVGASVGIAEHPAGAGDPRRLLADADAAMYAAKVARRGGRERAVAHAGV